jgi:hypothetical protein
VVCCHYLTYLKGLTGGADWSRLTEYEAKKFCRADLPVEEGAAAERLYFYPPAGDDPSPMYEGLRTNLPTVSRFHSI